MTSEYNMKPPKITIFVVIIRKMRCCGVIRRRHCPGRLLGRGGHLHQGPCRALNRIFAGYGGSLLAEGGYNRHHGGSSSRSVDAGQDGRASGRGLPASAGGGARGGVCPGVAPPAGPTVEPAPASPPEGAPASAPDSAIFPVSDMTGTRT